MKHYRYKLDKIQVVFEKSAIDTMASKAQFNSTEKERGGLLLGRLFPKENLVVVVDAIESPAISSGASKLYVDNNTANKEMKKRWQDSGGKVTYVGDWHTHPEAVPTPSFIDRDTFKDTYRSSKIDQNFLLCVIVGTNPIDKDGFWVGIQRWFKLYQFYYDITNKLFCM